MSRLRLLARTKVSYAGYDWEIVTVDNRQKLTSLKRENGITCLAPTSELGSPGRHKIPVPSEYEALPENIKNLYGDLVALDRTAKDKERLAKKNSCSRSTVYRQLEKARRGPEELKRKRRADFGNSSFETRVKDIIEAEVKRAPAFRSNREIAKRALNEMHKPDKDDKYIEKIPSKSTVLRYVSRERGKVPYDPSKDAPHVKPIHPFDELEMDSTQADTYVVYDDYKEGRPWLTSVVEVLTGLRWILVTREEPSSRITGLLIIMVVFGLDLPHVKNKPPNGLFEKLLVVAHLRLPTLTSRL